MRVAAFAVWASSLVLTLPLAAPAYGETLQEAVIQTLKTNPDVLIDVSRLLSLTEGANQAKGGYLPRVDLAYGVGLQRSDNLTTRTTYGGAIGQRRYDRSLTLSQMLFDGFATAAEVERGAGKVDSAANKLATTSEQVALKAIEAYLEVLRNQELVALTEENVTGHQRTYDQIKLRASSGVGRKADLDQIESRLALSRSNLTAAEANLQIAEINYRLVVGSKPQMPVKPDGPDQSQFPSSLDDAIKKALANSRLLKTAKAEIDVANAQHKAAKSAMYPRFDLELSVSKNDLTTPIDISTDSSRSAMVRLRYNLFKGNVDISHIAEARHLINEAEEQMHRSERQVEQSVRLSWNAYSSAKERLPFLIKHTESSQLTRDAYAKQFGMGQRTLLDLLDTENEAFTASSNFLNGQYVELFARYRVLADISLLLDAVGVPHREETQLFAR